MYLKFSTSFLPFYLFLQVFDLTQSTLSLHYIRTYNTTHVDDVDNLLSPSSFPFSLHFLLFLLYFIHNNKFFFLPVKIPFRFLNIISLLFEKFLMGIGESEKVELNTLWCRINHLITKSTIYNHLVGESDNNTVTFYIKKK